MVMIEITYGWYESVGTWRSCDEENSVLSAYFSIMDCGGTCYWSWDIDVFIGPADPCFTECPDNAIWWENTIKDQCRHTLNSDLVVLSNNDIFLNPFSVSGEI